MQPYCSKSIYYVLILYYVRHQHFLHFTPECVLVLALNRLCSFCKESDVLCYPSSPRASGNSNTHTLWLGLGCNTTKQEQGERESRKAGKQIQSGPFPPGHIYTTKHSWVLSHELHLSSTCMETLHLRTVHGRKGWEKREIFVRLLYIYAF